MAARSAAGFAFQATFCLWSGLVQSPAQILPPPLRGSTAPVRWSSYVQFRYTDVQAGQDLFGLRRFKLMVGGNVTPKIQWYAQALYKDGNDSPTDGRVYFQEGWLRFGFRKEVQLVFGQFKPPFGRERFTPDFLILTIDRSLVTDALTPDGPYTDSFYRDRGVQFDGEVKRGLRYAAAVFDGRGANHQFHGIGPMVVGQVVHDVVQKKLLYDRPLRLQIGAATALRWGRDLPFRPCCTGEFATDIERFRGADQRWGAEFSADWGDASVRAEYIRARLDFDSARSADLTASGWYVLVAKYLTPKWQAVAKHERLDPNDHVVNNKDVRQTTLGLNYYIHQNRLKVMAGYVIRQEKIQPVSNNLFQVQVQYFLPWPGHHQARGP